MFKTFLKGLQTVIQNDMKSGYFGKNPSVVGNLLMGEPWNANTKWGQKKEYELKPWERPNGEMYLPPKMEKERNQAVLNKAKQYKTEGNPLVNILEAVQSKGLKMGKHNPQPPKGAIQGIQPSPTNIPTPTPTPDPRENWRNMADMIMREGNARGYHGETLVRQKANESTWGESNFAKDRYNYGGVGAYTNNPENAYRYASPEDYLMGYGTKGEPGYFNLIEKDPRYKEAYKHRGNPKRYAEELKNAGYATDPLYVWKILNTPMYRD